MISIVILALFSFAFLGTEYIFDNTVAYFTTSDGVVMAQNFILGVSAVGFVIYPFVRRWFSFTKKACTCVAFFIVSFCMYCVYAHPSYEILLLSGMICYFLFGMLSSHVYDLAARSWNRGRHIARAVGIAYALGIGLQYVNNNIVVNTAAQLIITVCIVALTLLLVYVEEGKVRETLSKAQADDKLFNEKVLLSVKSPEKAGALLIAIVAFMACLFSTQDIAVTLVHANGTYDVGQLPRILLAVSGLAAGFFFDLGKRKYMYLSMACVTLLSVIGIVVMQFGGSFLVGLAAFYLSGGFFVVFFSTSFIDISYECRRPALWAGLGRAVNNMCALLLSVLTLFLQQRLDGMGIMVMSLVLLTGVVLCTFLFMTKLVGSAVAVTSVDGMRSNGISDAVFSVKRVSENAEGDEKFVAFCNTYSLTERERDVMRALLQNDKKMQDIAGMLFISRTALYRYVAQLNKKTQTNNRISLIQFYHQWKN